MKLLDTNIFLEIFLEQEKAEIAKAFINSQETGTMFLSNYSFDSIGLKLYWSKKLDCLGQFGLDLKTSLIPILSLEPDDLSTLSENIQKWNLDFDDAYQYTLAKKYNLDLVSFDKDFDKTDLKRIEPK